jgi:hypothetical protein
MRMLKVLGSIDVSARARWSILGTIGALSLLGASTVHAYVAPTPTATVTLVEGSYVPDQFYFQVDQPVANCIAGAYLLWQGGGTFLRGTADDSMRRANVRYMAQALLLQKALGAKITVYAAAVATGNQYCVVENIHIPQ